MTSSSIWAFSAAARADIAVIAVRFFTEIVKGSRHLYFVPFRIDQRKIQRAASRMIGIADVRIRYEIPVGTDFPETELRGNRAVSIPDFNPVALL